MEIWNKIIDFFLNNGGKIETVVDILQGLVIIFITVFTARWTYKTFAHKEKINDLKKLKNLIMEYSEQIDWFSAQVRNNDKPDKEELKEKDNLLLIYRKFIRLNATSLYLKPDTRDKIQKIVGKWLTDSERLKAMQSRKSEEERKKAWAEYESEYEEVINIIDKIAKKLV